MEGLGSLNMYHCVWTKITHLIYRDIWWGSWMNKNSHLIYKDQRVILGVHQSYKYWFPEVWVPMNPFWQRYTASRQPSWHFHWHRTRTSSGGGNFKWEPALIGGGIGDSRILGLGLFPWKNFRDNFLLSRECIVSYYGNSANCNYSRNTPYPLGFFCLNLFQ